MKTFPPLNPKPLVSVIMNCFNGEKYLREAIDSIYAQSYQNWEIIFWDNVSKDQSANIAKSYDDRIKYFLAEENKPLGWARSLAVKKASGQLVAFLDCDDIWLPNKLDLQVAAMMDGRYAMCYAGIEEIREDDGSLIRVVVPRCRSGEQFEAQLRQFDINMVTPVIRREVFDQGLNFDRKIIASEEQDLFLRLAGQYQICSITEVLGRWRLGGSTLTDRAMKNWSEDRGRTLSTLRRDFPGIEKRFPAAFAEAYARAGYYRCRYLMSQKRCAEARQAMAPYKAQSLKYRLIYVALYFPYMLWEALHSQSIKRKLIPVVHKLLDWKQTR